MSQSPVTFALVGYGFIGRRHAEIISGHPDCRLAAVVEPDAQHRAAAAKAHGVAVFDSLEAYLATAPEVEVISIATPNHLHTSLAERALQAGHHVIIEKPMGLSAADCARVMAVKSTAQHIFCVMQNRYTPSAQWLKEIVEGGQLGALVYVGVKCFWNRDKRYYTPGGWRGTADKDGGTLYTQFSHFVDMMYWLFGDIVDVQAQVANLTHGDRIAIEDTGHAMFRFVQGGMGGIQFSTSVWDQNQESSITIVGEQGSVRIGGQYMNALEYCHIKGVESPTLAPANPPNDYGAYKGSSANHHYVFQNTVDTLRGNAQPDATAAEGRAVVDIIERIYSVAS